MMNKRILPLLLLLLISAILVGINFGPTNIHLTDLFNADFAPILYLRIARVVLGLVAGAGLAVSGLIFQGILRNSLAEPYVLGVSSGAGLGAVLALFFNLAIGLLPVASFLGATITMYMVYALAKIHGRVSNSNLLLSGVIVGAVFSSLLLFFVSISPNEAMHGITWWLLGSLQVYNARLIVAVSILILASIAVAFYFSRDLNAISLGEEEAHHLGIDVEGVRKILFIVASLITASIVCVCGIIGFVGLIVPHAMRLLLGSDNRILIPSSALAAAVFLILADTLSRVLMPPLEIPLGVITALIGGPVFIFLLRKKQATPFRL